MIRQAVFATILIAASGSALAQTNAQAAKTPPPAEIAFQRLTPDAAIPLVMAPGSIETSDAVWMVNRAAGTIVRIDAKDNKSGAPVVVGGEPCGSLLVAFESVWVPRCDGTVTRIDPKTSKSTATLETKLPGPDGRLAMAVGSVWAITERKGVVSRIDPATNGVVAEVYVAAGANDIVFGEDALWITSETGDLLTRVNPHTNEIIETIKVGPRPGGVAIGEGGIWTLNRGDGSVTRVDPATNKVVATIALGNAAAGQIAAGLGSVWVSAPGAPLIRIDPRNNRAVQRFTGDGGGAIRAAHGSLWVAAGPQLTWRLDPVLVASIRP